ncbi:BRCA1-associated RING domain protein 1-like isoform X2 [Amaranthus tricolor]|uniref:BRCA1-associated RING domain protein 1-like isoform X2 n=1 Tax=Amaranthus tricolor TaxID=29722 RepID=UPI002588F065|nr:BRCA1-associated RING domain protein 1-like isoform X2 [Amaranthus tricolor]
MGESHNHAYFLNSWVLHLQKLGFTLTCSLCLKVYNEPMLLPCDHIFCSFCLPNSYLFGLQCPLCKFPYLEQGLRQAPFVENVVNIYKSLKPSFSMHMLNSDIEGGFVPCSFLTDAKYSNQIAKDLTKPPHGNSTSKTRGNTEQHETVNVDVNQIQLFPDSPSSRFSKGINGHDPGSSDIVGKCLSNKLAKRTADDYGAYGYNSKKQKQLDQGLPEMNQGSTTSEAVNLENSVCAGSDMTNTRNNTDNQQIFDFDSATLLNFKCAFCRTWKITEGSGPMQHFANGRQVFAHEASHSHVVHLHHSCLDWAPQIFYVNDTTIKNLDKELARAGKLKCAQCGLKGAALGCYVKSCRKSYHAPCAFEVKECRWDDDHFLMLCPDHASQKFPREKSKKPAPKKYSSAPGHNEQKNSRDLDFWATSHSGAKNWVFCGSALSADEKYMLVKFANLCGATVTKSWNPNVTHVIATTDANGACSRTLKVLMAILNGRWILKTDSCMQSKLPINEEPYEISLDNHGCCNGPKTGRLRLLNNEQKLFDNLKFFFYGDFVSSFKRDLQNLVMTGGGTILKADELQPSSGKQCYQPSTSIIVYNDDSIEVNEIVQRQVEAKKVALESGSQVIAYTWILDSIASGLLKPFVQKM